MEIKVHKGDFQDRFLFSESKFPLCKAGVGTGKTLLMLVKIYDYCEKWPGTTALIVRKEFTDLHDSTINDFQNYFQITVGTDKNYTLPNGSKIMFRHAAEIEVLKNINLGIAGIEQAEEFEDNKQFTFIRDRLRQQNGASVRPLIVIANANGHNWIHSLWIAGANRQEIDAATGQYHFTKESIIIDPDTQAEEVVRYECLTATTFANKRNLPPDFITDCRAKEIDAPHHYQQYIMNDDDVTQQDDFVFTFQELEESRLRQFAKREGYGLKLTGFDIARYGNDKCAAVCIQQMGALIWKVRHVDEWEHKDLAYTTGRILATVAELNSDGQIIDEDGMGAGPLDVINKDIKDDEARYKGFRNITYSYEENRFYGNPRTANVFKLKDYILKGWISLSDEGVCQELLTLRYTFMTDGRRILISKEKMRKEGIKSPNKADALIMAISLIGKIKARQDRMYQSSRPQIAKEQSLFEIAGIR